MIEAIAHTVIGIGSGVAIVLFYEFAVRPVLFALLFDDDTNEVNRDG